MTAVIFGFLWVDSKFSLDNKDTLAALYKRIDEARLTMPFLREQPALAAPQQTMATTLASVEAREVLRCDHCSLVQFRTTNSRCRRCHKALEIEEPIPQLPTLVISTPGCEAAPEGLQVARAVRDIRHNRGLSQRQLAGRMMVPRTYISKIENAKAMPTLSSLQRLATALDIDIRELLQDARSRRDIELAGVLADPFLAELAPFIAQMDGLQRSMFLNQVRDMALGRNRKLA